MKIDSVWPRKFELVTAFFMMINFTVNSAWNRSEKNINADIGPAVNQSDVHGEDVEQGEFPFLVALRIELKRECVGTLVSKSSTLTACRCLMRDLWDPIIKIPHRLKEPSRVLVHAGTIDLNDPSNRGWTERAKTLQVHPRCARNSSTSFTQYDFGLVKVENPFILSPFRVAVITLPDFGRLDVTDMLRGNPVPCVTMGWISDLEMHRTWVTNLEMFHVTIQTPEWCRQSIINHTTLEGDPFIYDRTFQICAKGSNDNQGVCKMDSGGPLLCGEGPSKEFIALITDGTEERHCGKGIPLVYARMDRVDKWILGSIKLSNTYIHTSNAYVTTVLVAILTFGC